MLEIGGKPVLQHNVELLAAAGITEVTINLHHQPEAIAGYFGDGSAFGIAIHYAYEPELLGTAGAARNVADRLRGDDFLVVYGDNLSTIDLRKLVGAHREKSADLTLALFRREDPSSSGIAELDSDDRITRYLEKPQQEEIFSTWVNAGYLAARPQVLDLIPAGSTFDFGRDLLPLLLDRGARLYGYRMTEPLWWIDSLDDYRRTKAAFEGAGA